MVCFEQQLYRSESRAQRLRARAAALGAEPGVIVLSMGSKRQHGALISACPVEAGRWRTTWFDMDGFSGHSMRDTKELSVLLALQEGYADRDRGLVTRLSRTEQFREGNERLEAVRQINEQQPLCA